MDFEILMSYFIYYDSSADKFVAKSRKEPLASGQGYSFHGAIDDLEINIRRRQLRGSLTSWADPRSYAISHLLDRLHRISDLVIFWKTYSLTALFPDDTYRTSILPDKVNKLGNFLINSCFSGQSWTIQWNVFLLLYRRLNVSLS